MSRQKRSLHNNPIPLTCMSPHIEASNCPSVTNLRLILKGQKRKGGQGTGEERGGRMGRKEKEGRREDFNLMISTWNPRVTEILNINQ